MLRLRTSQLARRFRELCEDTSGVKALAFLQTEVSSVVDHSNAEEAEAFRNLLSHLLSLPPGGTSSTTSAAVASDADEDKDTPMRSSASTPLPPQDEEIIDTATAGQQSLETAVTYEEDPVEEAMGIDSRPSPARFRQRTQVFERLLTFVNAGAKQPEKNLLDSINTDDMD